jgi:hypothetical protein
VFPFLGYYDVILGFGPERTSCLASSHKFRNCISSVNESCIRNCTRHSSSLCGYGICMMRKLSHNGSGSMVSTIWSKPPPVKKSDDLFCPTYVSLVSHFSFPRSHASPLSSHPSLLLLLRGSGGITPGKKFEIVHACRRVLAHFGRKNPVFGELTKSSPNFGKKSSPYLFHGALLQAIWCRRP